MSVPRLRFKDFSGEWKKIKLEEVYPNIRNGFVGIATPYYVDNGVKYLQGKNIKNGAIDDDGLIYVSDEFQDKYKKSQLRLNDIVMVQSGHVGECAVIDDKHVNANCHALVILSPKDKKTLASKFLVYYFYSQYGNRLIYQVKTGNTIEHILASEVKKLTPFFPEFPEQTKIANFLTAIDEKISQLTQKCDLLAQYKKGVMQQIFSQKIRFKDDDGREFPKWEDKKLDEIGTSFNGLIGKSGDDFGAGKNYITYKQIFDNNQIDISKFSQVKIGDNEKQNKVEFGDVFFTTSSETPNEVGFCSVLLSEVSEVYLNSFCFGYRISSFELLNPIFASFIFRSTYFRNDVVKLAQGSTRYNISKSAFMQIKINLPSEKEQTKIANFLTAIDDKITNTQAQLAAMKHYKQGLLQQMFV